MSGFWAQLQFLREIMKISLKAKLVISFLAVIVICGLVAILVAIRLIGTGIINQAQEKVRIDLNSARQIYREGSEDLKDVVRFTALRFFIKDAIRDNDMETLQKELEKIREAESLDILTLTDKNGRVVLRTRNPSIIGDDQIQDELVGRALSSGEVASGTVVIPRDELLKEGVDLADQAYIKFIRTEMEKPSSETEQSSGMMIKAAAPIKDYSGNLLGVLYGGNLLNRNYKIVDQVKETVYQGVKYKGKDIGTATIFQWDLRVSTNVMGENGDRAIGTRVSEEVYEQVLEKGLPWIDRAYVVDHWYIAAYEPIKDIGGKIIGILYVGILEEKFMDMRTRAIAIFLGITLVGMIMALVGANFLAKSMLKPVKRLVSASHEWATGNLDYRVKTAGEDEIAELGDTFNLMASSLKERHNRLKEYAEQQIMKSERLATLGQLAAGVAHEINNPLGAILMYSHLSLEEMESDDACRRNIEKVAGETTRCRDIVKGLLDFARQTEPKVENSSVNEILNRTLSLVENQALFQNVKINKLLSPSLPKILMDSSQIQQVFTNIILNAAEAMEGEGELTVITRIAPDNKHIELEFTDTGCGISLESYEKIFDPFFTTKEVGHGTGLGLAVSFGIVTRHRGTIDVRSEPGKGSSFIIKLPVSMED